MRSKEVDEAINNLFHLQHINTYLDLNKDDFKIKNETMIEWSKSTDTVLSYIEQLEKYMTMLENTKNICPALNTSGALCPIKAITSGEPIENALVMPNVKNVTKEIENDIRRKIEDANRFNPFNGKYEK